MPENISIRIDGEYVPAQEGQTILEVARAEASTFQRSAGWPARRRWARAASASSRSPA